MCNQACCTGKGGFKTLLRFCRALACNFLGIAHLESDFSIVKFEKNTVRQFLTHLSLEDVSHSKQFGVLKVS